MGIGGSKGAMDKTAGGITQELEQAMVSMLYHEWDHVVWGLRLREPAVAARLTRPAIVIQDMKGTLGKWNPFLEEIVMQRELLHNGRWDSICEVLRHEIAHQLAATFPEYANDKPHGRLFFACCGAVGANPEASGTYKTLEERVWGDGASENDRIMIKVKKLMGLATSKNRHEAESAAAKAGELIAKYNLESIKSNEKRQFVSIIITKASLKRTQAESLASTILSRHYFVKPVWVPIYVPEKNKMGLVLEISGTPSNVRIADYVFAFVINYALGSWQEYRRSNPACRSKSGHMTGVVRGFMEKLDKGKQELCRKDYQGMGELMVLEDGQLSAYFGHRYPRLKNLSMSHSSSSHDAYNSGLAKGRDLIVSKAIVSRESNSGKLIRG